MQRVNACLTCTPLKLKVHWMIYIQILNNLHVRLSLEQAGDIHLRICIVMMAISLLIHAILLYTGSIPTGAL